MVDGTEPIQGIIECELFFIERRQGSKERGIRKKAGLGQGGGKQPGPSKRKTRMQKNNNTNANKHKRHCLRVNSSIRDGFLPVGQDFVFFSQGRFSIIGIGKR